MKTKNKTRLKKLNTINTDNLQLRSKRKISKKPFIAVALVMLIVVAAISIQSIKPKKMSVSLDIDRSAVNVKNEDPLTVSSSFATFNVKRSVYNEKDVYKLVNTCYKGSEELRDYNTDSQVNWEGTDQSTTALYGNTWQLSIGGDRCEAKLQVNEKTYQSLSYKVQS